MEAGEPVDGQLLRLHISLAPQLNPAGFVSIPKVLFYKITGIPDIVGLSKYVNRNTNVPLKCGTIFHRKKLPVV